MTGEQLEALRAVIDTFWLEPEEFTARSGDPSIDRVWGHLMVLRAWVKDVEAGHEHQS